MNVSFTMFNNYHLAAKEYANGDINVYGRLMLIVNTYAIEGIILDDLSPVEKLFLSSIKASIDKSLRLSEAGRKGGSHSANKPEETEAPDVTEEPADNTETSECSFSEEKTEACKPFEMACNEEEEETEILTRTMNLKKETEQNKKGNPPDFSVSDLFGSDFVLSHTENLVFDWIKSNRLMITVRNKANLFKISNFLEDQKLGIDFLDYSYGLIKELYPKPSLGMLYSSFTWENTLPGFNASRKKRLKNIKANPPKKCSICGSGLVERINNLVECPECRKAGNPIWWELNPELNKWVCSL